MQNTHDKCTLPLLLPIQAVPQDLLTSLRLRHSFNELGSIKKVATFVNYYNREKGTALTTTTKALRGICFKREGEATEEQETSRLFSFALGPRIFITQRQQLKIRKPAARIGPRRLLKQHGARIFISCLPLSSLDNNRRADLFSCAKHLKPRSAICPRGIG